MNAQEAILKIKSLFDDNIAPIEAESAPIEETKMEMYEYSLMDGTKVEISELEIGGMVTLEGNPAPVGDHELMDGTQITLDDNGIITAIKTKVVEASPEVDVEAGYDKKKEEEMAEAFEAKIAELMEANEAKIAELENKVKQGFAQVAELIEALSIAPTEDPIQKPNSFSEFVKTKSIKEERINKYRQAILNK